MLFCTFSRALAISLEHCVSGLKDRKDLSVAEFCHRVDVARDAFGKLEKVSSNSSSYILTCSSSSITDSSNTIKSSNSWCENIIHYTDVR